MNTKRHKVMKVEEGFVLPIRLELCDQHGNRVLPIGCQYVSVISSSPDIAQIESEYMGEHMGFYFKPLRQGELHITILAKRRDGEFIRDWQRVNIIGPRLIPLFGEKPIFAVTLIPQED